MKAELGVTTLVTEPTEDSYEMVLFDLHFPSRDNRAFADFPRNRRAVCGFRHRFRAFRSRHSNVGKRL